MRTVLLVSCVSLLSPCLASPADVGFAARLPEQTFFFVTAEHLGEVASAVAASSFYCRLLAIPQVASALERGAFPDLVAEWERLTASEHGPLCRAVASLLEREVVVASTGNGSRGIVPGILQLARVALLAQELRLGHDPLIAERLREAAREASNRVGLEPFLLAFRTDRRPTLEPLVEQVLTRLPPALAPMRAREEIEGVSFETLAVVPGLLLPPDTVRPALTTLVGDSAAVETLLATFADLTLTLRIGWLDDYLVLVGEDHRGSLASQVARGPGGPSLADMEEFQELLARSRHHPLRRAVVNLRPWRTNLLPQVQALGEDLRRCPTVMGMAKGLGLDAALLAQRIQEWCDRAMDPSLVLCAADLDGGIRLVADLHFAQGSPSCLMGAKHLALAAKVPPSALAWFVWGGPQAPEAWRVSLDEGLSWRTTPWRPMLPQPHSPALEGAITEVLTLTRDRLTPLLGEEGMVVLSWSGSRPDAPQVDPSIPEVALLLEVRDRAKVRSLGSAYARPLARILWPSAEGPPTLPPPSSAKVKHGERFWWDDLMGPRGGGIQPTVYLTDRFLVLSSSPRLADEAYETLRGRTRGKGWPEGEGESLVRGPCSGAGVVLVGELAEALGSLLDVAVDTTVVSPEERARRAFDLKAVLGLAQAVPLVWGHVRLEAHTGFLTAMIELRDLPVP